MAFRTTPAARSNHGASMLCNYKMCVFGGYGGGTFLSDMCVLDLKNKPAAWSAVNILGVISFAACETKAPKA